MLFTTRILPYAGAFLFFPTLGSRETFEGSLSAGFALPQMGGLTQTLVRRSIAFATRDESPWIGGVVDAKLLVWAHWGILKMTTKCPRNAEVRARQPKGMHVLAPEYQALTICKVRARLPLKRPTRTRWLTPSRGLSKPQSN